MRPLNYVLILSLAAIGCQKSSPISAESQPQTETKAETKQKTPEISVSDAEKAFASGAVPIDANVEKVRAENGAIQNAVLLTSASDYALTQLPPDKNKQLVFYCANTSCTASDIAAERAKASGYNNVYIMRAGIKGWKDTGNTTAPYSKS